MTKVVCDICGKEIPSSKYADSTTTYSIKNFNFCISSRGIIWDVCGECRESFNKWKDTRKMESEEWRKRRTINEQN